MTARGAAGTGPSRWCRAGSPGATARSATRKLNEPIPWPTSKRMPRARAAQTSSRTRSTARRPSGQSLKQYVTTSPGRSRASCSRSAQSSSRRGPNRSGSPVSLGGLEARPEDRPGIGAAAGRPGDVDGDPPDRALALLPCGPDRRRAGRRVDVVRRLAGAPHRGLAPSRDVDREPDARPRGREHGRPDSARGSGPPPRPERAPWSFRTAGGGRSGSTPYRDSPRAGCAWRSISPGRRTASGSRTTSRAGPSTPGPAPAIRPPTIADGPRPVEPRRRADHPPRMDHEIEGNGWDLLRGRLRHHRGGSRITWERRFGAPLWVDEATGRP